MHILETVTGSHIDIPDESQLILPAERIVKFSNSNGNLIDIEIQKLLSKGVIVPKTSTEGECISPIFTRGKK